MTKQIIDNIIHLSFPEGDKYHFAPSDMTPEIVEYALARAIHDYVMDAGTSGGADATDEERVAARRAAFNRIAEGHVPSSGGGGGKLSDAERIQRDTVVTLLRKAGMKAVEAQKIARDPKWDEKLSEILDKPADQIRASIDGIVQRQLDAMSGLDELTI